MNIRQLRYFLTIAEEHHITSAANKLNISQPPLSNQLRQLEEELGVRLFYRRKREMILTEEGKLLQKRARSILREYEGTLEEFSNLKKGTAGILYIATVCSAALHFVPKSILEFKKQSPGTDLQIFETDCSQVDALLKKGTAELGITREPFDHSEFEYLYLNTPNDPFVAIADSHWISLSSPGELSLSSLAGKPLIVHRFYEPLTTELCTKCNFKPKYICTNENVMTSLIWALEGLGIALVPKSSARLLSLLKDGEKLNVYKIINPSISSATALIWKKDAYLSPISNKFIEFLKTNPVAP